MSAKRGRILFGSFAALLLIGLVCGFSARPLFFRILKGAPGEHSATIVNGLDTPICEIYLTNRDVELEPQGFNKLNDLSPLEPEAFILVQGLHQGIVYRVTTFGCQEDDPRLESGFFEITSDNDEWIVVP